MLVQVITRYPSPLPDMLASSAILNEQQFGSPDISLIGQALHLTSIENQQTFGVPQIARLLAPSRLINTAVFGGPLVAPIVHGTHELMPSVVINVSQFGGLMAVGPPMDIVPAAIINGSQFGIPAVGVAQKTFSYSNPLGSGDRTSLITVTTSGGSVFDSPMQLVNGNTIENAFWGTGAVTITFDLGVSNVIRQARWVQDTSTTHFGLWQWRGSNDNVDYADIGGTFVLGGAPVSLCNTLLENATAYRWYRLSPAEGGSLNATPYLREIEFYIEGGADEPPD